MGEPLAGARGKSVALKDVRDAVRGRSAAGLLLLALISPGCGAGAAGEGAATPDRASVSAAAPAPTASDRTQTVCSAWVDVDAAAARVLMNADLGSGTPEQLQAIVKEFWSAQEPSLASMEPAPDQIRADVGTLLAVARHGASTGDGSTFSSPEVAAADRNIDQYMLRECGYEHIQVTATDSAYQGLPPTVRSGAVGITLVNQGVDAHQVLIVRVRDGVTEPFAELLDLPPEQRVQMATPVGSVEAEPGETSTVFLRLSPGRYGAADFLAQGAGLAPPGSAMPYYSLGLQGEFTAT